MYIWIWLGAGKRQKGSWYKGTCRISVVRQGFYFCCPIHRSSYHPSSFVAAVIIHFDTPYYCIGLFFYSSPAYPLCIHRLFFLTQSRVHTSWAPACPTVRPNAWILSNLWYKIPCWYKDFALGYHWFCKGLFSLLLLMTFIHQIFEMHLLATIIPPPKKRKVTLNNIWNIQGHQMKASYQKELLIDDKHVLGWQYALDEPLLVLLLRVLCSHVYAEHIYCLARVIYFAIVDIEWTWYKQTWTLEKFDRIWHPRDNYWLLF